MTKLHCTPSELTDAQAQQLFDRYGVELRPGEEYAAVSWAPSWRTPLRRLAWHWKLRTLRSYWYEAGVVPTVEEDPKKKKAPRP